MSNVIQPRLPYNYAQIDPTTYRCRACKTYSYEINNVYYIPIPYTTDDYLDKYYDLNNTNLWYHDSGFQNLWEECPSHNI